jgi:hypothetical protein
MTRQGNRPDRRLAKPDLLDRDRREALAVALVYVGSAHHKRSPGDYKFTPPVNPRPSKCLCDGDRVVLKAEAREIFRKGILMGMFSADAGAGQPKYVWGVDDQGGVYEAKIGLGGYHGYRLEDVDDQCARVLKEWRQRCPRD